MTSVTIGGFDRLERALIQLPIRNSKNVLRRSIRAGIKVVLDQAKLNVPVESGLLRKSLGIRFKRGRPGQVFVQMGPRKNRDKKKDPWYAHLVEFGTRPHSLRKRDKLANFRTGRRSRQTQGSKMHPGARSKPFLRPAFDTKAQDAIDKFRDEVFRNIDVEIRRLAG